jgi:hypothetical protein
MRILPPSTINNGFEPSQPELNTEKGVLDIGSSSECDLIEESKLVAETLILRCTLKPVPYLNRDIRVRLIVQSNPLEDALLYDKGSLTYGYEREFEHSMVQGIALDYMGMGRGIQRGESFVFEGTDLNEGCIKSTHPLYVKPFSVETQSHVERTTSLHSGQILISPPGALSARILRGFGGYYKEGIKFEDIQQVYYSLTAVDDKTRVRLFSSTLLHEQHTPAPQGGRDFNKQILFHPHPDRHEYLSLSGALAEGFCSLSVEHEGGITKFSSTFGEPIVGHPTLLDVYFKPSTL